jgi:hypothetical protein
MERKTFSSTILRIYCQMIVAFGFKAVGKEHEDNHVNEHQNCKQQILHDFIVEFVTGDDKRDNQVAACDCELKTRN